MKERCGTPHCHKAVIGAQDGALQGLTIEPPPKEKGPGRFYRVVYTIDVNAMHAKQAAERAYEMMKDPQSMRPVLEIIDSESRLTRIDLSEE